jgi:hypothetical protein
MNDSQDILICKSYLNRLERNPKFSSKSTRRIFMNFEDNVSVDSTSSTSESNSDDVDDGCGFFDVD